MKINIGKLILNQMKLMMQNKILLAVGCFFIVTITKVNAQNKNYVKTGIASFYAEKLKDTQGNNISPEEINKLQKEFMQITAVINAISKERGWVVFK